MPYTPPTHTPFQWSNYPDIRTPLDEGNLEAAGQDQVDFTRAVASDLATQIGAGTVSLPTSVLNGSSIAAGNLGAAYTVDFQSVPNRQLTITATLSTGASPCTVTFVNRANGCTALLLFAQDGTGGRTLVISDGSNSAAVTIPSLPSATFAFEVTSPNAIDLYVTQTSGSSIPQTQPSAIAQGIATFLIAAGFDGAGSLVEMVAGAILTDPADGGLYIPFSTYTDQNLGVAKSASSSQIALPLTKQPSYIVHNVSGLREFGLIRTPPSDSKFSAYYPNTSSGTALTQTASGAGIDSTYSVTNAALLSTSVSAPDFDFDRATGLCVFTGPSAQPMMLYTGYNVANGVKQIGLATSSGDFTGPFTKYGSNPVIANGPSAYDAAVCANPICFSYQGLYYILYGAGVSGSTANSQIVGGIALATTHDFVTFTKRGLVLTPAARNVSPNDLNPIGIFCSGAIWWPGKDPTDNTNTVPPGLTDIYITLGGQFASGARTTSNPYQQFLYRINPQAIYSGAILSNPWTRHEAENLGDAQITTTGSGWTRNQTSTFGYSGGAFSFTSNPGDTMTFAWTGQRVRVYLRQRPNYGVCNILLDGSLVYTYSAAWNVLESPTSGTPCIAYDSPDLLLGGHTLQIVAVSGFTGVDCFEQI